MQVYVLCAEAQAVEPRIQGPIPRNELLSPRACHPTPCISGPAWMPQASLQHRRVSEKPTKTPHQFTWGSRPMGCCKAVWGTQSQPNGFVRQDRDPKGATVLYTHLAHFRRDTFSRDLLILGRVLMHQKANFHVGLIAKAYIDGDKLLDIF